VVSIKAIKACAPTGRSVVRDQKSSKNLPVARAVPRGTVAGQTPRASEKTEPQAKLKPWDRSKCMVNSWFNFKTKLQFFQIADSNSFWKQAGAV